jgi:hypothetical protein
MGTSRHEERNPNPETRQSLVMLRDRPWKAGWLDASRAQRKKGRALALDRALPAAAQLSSAKDQLRTSCNAVPLDFSQP